MAGDSYRPPPRAPPPTLASRMTFTHGGGDNYDTYRPARAGGEIGLPRGEFTFTTGRQGPQFPPAGPADPNQSHRRRNIPGRGYANNRHPSEHPNAPQYSQRNRRNQHNPVNGRSRERGGHRHTFRKAAPHERALLQTRNGASPERTLGVTEGVNKFLAVDDLSASESDMEIDDGDGSDTESVRESREPSHKMARVQTTTRDDGDSVPKWSNPDPYTVLPPPSETGKKKDFVQLIRKAKIQAAEKSPTSNAVTANDDFISFGDEEDEESSLPAIPPPPSGARPPEPPVPPPPPPPPSYPPTNSPPLTGSLNDVSATGMLASAGHGMKHSADSAGLPPRPSEMAPRPTKRKRDQFIGGIVEEWLSTPHTNPAPWCKNRAYTEKITEREGSDYEKMLMLFHNEIMDFYDYVEPSVRDETVRARLISRIENLLGPKNAALTGKSTVQCFGSFPAKLYLPTADMDLVLVSNQHRNGGLSTLGSKSAVSRVLWASARKLERAGITIKASVIARAKVPIIKFVDRESGINVDLSFENLSGVVAQETFRKWTGEMPHMFPMVALIKQFLVMRGLSDVHYGGIGGFSIICLVYTYLRANKPSNSQDEIVNLANVFMGFLDFWGNKFDLTTQRLEMTSDPPKLVPKQELGIDGRKEKWDGLSIQDPNNPMNNVSGGSHRAMHVFRLFSQAHEALQQRLETLDISGISILETIIGGNYESYTSHWNQLRRLT